MATPVTPAMPSAPAAPSAPATPAAPPAAPPSAPPTTPEAPATPPAAPVTPPAEAPVVPAAPYDPKTAPKPPVNTDYPNTTEGQARYATEMNRWYREHPDGAPADVDPAAVAQEGAKEPPKTAEAEAAAEANKEAKPAEAPEAAATPQALADILKDNAALNAALEADPKAKGAIFSMARELAEVAPIKAMFPTVADAEFAQEYSANMVGLKTAALRMIDNPDNAPAFLDLYDSQFARVDAEGKPILDAQGNPTYDADRDTTIQALFNREVQQYTSKFSAEIGQLKTKLAGNYPSDAARNADQARLDNLEYAQTALSVLDQIRDGSFFDTPAPEAPADATPEVKAWYEEQKANLAKQKQELEDQKKGANKDERTAAAANFQNAVRSDMGATTATHIGSALKAVTDSGVYIPEFYMQEMFVDPKTGQTTKTPALFARVFMKFESELMKPGSRTLMDIANHELLPPTDQTKAIRKAWYEKQAARIIPNLVNAEVDRIQSLVKLDQDKQNERLKERNRVASPEPSTGGSSLPQGASREQVLAAAEEAAKKDPGFAESSPSEKQARILTQVHRMGKK